MNMIIQYQKFIPLNKLISFELIIKTQNKKMGQTISKIETSNNFKMSQYQQKLQFVQTMEDKYFGSVDIYRLKQPPYQYIMDYQKCYFQGDNRHIKYMSSMQQLSKIQHKNLAKIHLTQLIEQTHMCVKDKKTHTFCNYYNFTLQQALNKKKQQQAIFTQSQLIYIMSCLVDLAEQLRRLGISVGNYGAKQIYLSPEGYLKMYLLEIQQANKHRIYYQALADRDTIEKSILAPQELKNLQNMEFQPTYDLWKADLFAIGFLIFQLIIQDDIKFYYNEQKNNYKFQRISFDIDAATKLYSPQFIKLLKCCLIQNPQKRYNLNNACSALNIIKKKSTTCTYCIRLHQDQGKKKTLSKKQNLQSSPKAPLGYLTKLTPSPISTMSNTMNSFRHSSSVKGEDRVKSPTFTDNTTDQYEKRKFGVEKKIVVNTKGLNH